MGGDHYQTDVTHTHTCSIEPHDTRGREREKEKTDKREKMTTKAIAMMMMAVLVACALTSATATKAPAAMNDAASVADDSVPPLEEIEDIPTSLWFRAEPSGRRGLKLYGGWWGGNFVTGGTWEWQSPWGGTATGTWGGGNGGRWCGYGWC